GYKVAFDPNGDILLTGSFQDTANFGGTDLVSAGAEDIFLAKYSGLDGHHLWSKRFGGTGLDVAYGVAVDSRGDGFITGLLLGLADFGCTQLGVAYGGYDSFVGKYSGADGSCLWARNYATNSDDVGYGVAVDPSDNVLVTGYFLGQINFGNGTPQFTSTT